MSVHILVVEDNPINAFVALKQISALGCVGSAVTSGLEAIEALKRGPYDVILMDCWLPDMDGYETTRAIRDIEQRTNARRVPIVAVTVDNDGESRSRCLSAGMDGHLAKPASIVDLRNVLAKFVR